MPYRKRSTRRRRKPASRGKIYGAAASQLIRDVSKLKGMVNVEYKFFDVLLNSTIFNTPTIQNINGVGQGTDDYQRDGDSIRIKSIQADFMLTRGDTDAVCRFLWVIDTQPYGPAPTWGDIINAYVPTIPVSGMRNLETRTRYIILKDKTMYLDAGDIDTKRLTWYKRMDMKTLFYSNSPAIQSHALYFCACTNTATGSPAVSIVGNNRIRYIDN